MAWSKVLKNFVIFHTDKTRPSRVTLTARARCGTSGPERGVGRILAAAPQTTQPLSRPGSFHTPLSGAAPSPMAAPRSAISISDPRYSASWLMPKSVRLPIPNRGGHLGNGDGYNRAGTVTNCFTFLRAERFSKIILAMLFELWQATAGRHLRANVSRTMLCAAPQQGRFRTERPLLIATSFFGNPRPSVATLPSLVLQRRGHLPWLPKLPEISAQAASNASPITFTV